MKRLIQKLEEYENRQKQYRLEKEELDKKHGKYKSPKKKWGIAALRMSLKGFVIVSVTPVIAGVYLMASNEYIGVRPIGGEKGNEFLNALSESIDRFAECRNLDGIEYPEKKSLCIMEEMSQGDMFMGDFIVVLSAANHALEAHDEKLAESTLASMEWMENYRHYDDIGADQEIGRGIEMIADSILYLPVRPFVSDEDNIFNVDKNTFVERKMDILREKRSELIEAFNL